MLKPPESEAELLDRAWQIAGLKLGQLAEKLHIATPENLLRNKGWIGETLELALGATAGSKPEPDFQLIGVELKTIPIKKNFIPKETTHVCTVPLSNTQGLNWNNSLVKQKLARVLWIPVESNQLIKLADRRIGSPLLWSPTIKEENLLKNDWQEFMEMISLGELEQITAHMGEALQIRPKGADSYALTETSDQQGHRSQALPRGFYLRSTFTAKLLKKHYHLVNLNSA